MNPMLLSRGTRIKSVLKHICIHERMLVLSLPLPPSLSLSLTHTHTHIYTLTLIRIRTAVRKLGP